jgi:6-phosphogluconolactonase (cycloisomerase 2 family)
MSLRGFRAVGLAGVLLLGVGSRFLWAQGQLFVTNQRDNSVTVYTRTANGNMMPIRTISGPATGLANPVGLVVDPVHNELTVSDDYIPGAITVYPLTASGNTAPLRSLVGAATGLSAPVGLALDTLHNELIVVNQNSNSIAVYDRTATGNAPPLRTIAGPATGLDTPQGIAFDPRNDELFVANYALHSITVYSRTANGNATPLRILAGDATGLNNPTGIAVNLASDEVAVSNFGNNSVTVYARTSNGNVPPLRTIAGVSTELIGPSGLTIDVAHDELVVANRTLSTVNVYAGTASGDVPPLRILTGGATELSTPAFVAVNNAAQYYTVTPCRVADTRNPAGPYGGPALSAGANRTFAIGGQCGIPSNAGAVAFNFTVTQPIGFGDVRIFPAGGALPLVSTLNWRPGQTRANNAVISLGASGDIGVRAESSGGGGSSLGRNDRVTVRVDQASDTVHFIIDVNGYFQ